MPILPPTCALVLLCAAASAQLTDLQPGRNFPTAVNAFGADHSEDVELGDLDNDGDKDVVIANGGNFGNQPNRIFVNQGGLQGGVEGTFIQETATRFAGLPVDASRDADFADVDADGDLDVYISNRGGSIQGQVSRIYTNQGGLQGGAVGYFLEGTEAFWGQLVSVAPAAEEPQPADGQGPWKDWSCDCDFGDLDDDGDLDLFHSSYGPNINGEEDSRLFLNDGDGRFDELSPWADPAADIRLHTLDLELVDVDGDFDIDVFISSRESQARAYRNNLTPAGWVGDPFTDVTQTALIDTNAVLIGSANYGCEYGDLDGDGDFDLWMTSYQNLKNRTLRNNGDFTFSRIQSWMNGDTQTDDSEADFFDYDGDGDLDAMIPGFVPNTNHIFTSSVAQGTTAAEGYLHRNGTTDDGGLAPWPETPPTGNTGTTLDAAVGDMDGDGDPDVLLGNDLGQPNRYWENTKGIPDTHAPGFAAITEQGDKGDGSDTIIHAAVRDNAAYYHVADYTSSLVYTVDGGMPTCVRMTSMGSQLFRGVIPGALDGTIAYHVEVVDDAGNVGVSTTREYVQTSSSTSPWQALGCGTTGSRGVPYLEGRGDLVPGAPITMLLLDAAPSAAASLFLSTSSSPVPFKGGVLHTVPVGLALALVTGDGGQIVFQLPFPAGVPAGAELYWQYAVADGAALGGVALSNAVLTSTP